ncbi:hypothetical protein PSTG_06403 [Puccinia striiformis f. sp. tritici PST-78]|uniref:Uncharacterized protein n=1 Tax=Puccinia striiformis f. sp. tritici PST-78 TaxID=1165861 RepID=A0A0L0VLR5_9BASI|nr:hypothetical protein PSTG_06403 [Puccinia striiformis f. sp. tritici PST-78]
MFDSTGKPPCCEKDALTHDDAVPGRGETPEEVTPKVVLGKNGPYSCLAYRIKHPDKRNEKSFNTPPSALIIFSSSSLEIFEIVIWFCCGVAVIAITGSLICPKECNHRRGFMGKTITQIRSSPRNGYRLIAVFDGSVYDSSYYIAVGPAIKAPTGPNYGSLFVME